MDGSNRRFMRAGVEQTLEPKVLGVILELLTRPGQLFTRDQLLDAVWGHRYVTPSTLSRAVTLARRAFQDEVGESKFIQTVHGAGYRYIGPFESQIALGATAPAVSAPPAAVRLPARLEALIGREADLLQLDRSFSSNRAITVIGTGGMGKTQCALEFARRKAPVFPDGVWFFDLAPLQDARQWVQALAAAFAVPPATDRVILDKVAGLLAGRTLLFVIDNCDRICTGVGAIVFELLRAAEGLHVLATSQQALNYVGEQLFRLPPLSLPQQIDTATESGLREVAVAPAAALLLTRIESHQPGFVLSTANAPSIVEICSRLDGMPLALELAAARFSLLSAEQVLNRLQDRFRLLVSDLTGRDPRHRSLLVLLDWSFRLLSARERQLLTWLSVFVRGWTVETAIEFSRASGGTPESLVDLLSGLVNKSLVAADTSLRPPRYTLLESVREFALSLLRESGDEGRARDAHLATIRLMCEKSHEEMLAGRMRESVAQLAHEHRNIEGAIEYAVATVNAPVAAHSIVGSLLLYFKARGSHVVAFAWARRALSIGADTQTLERGRALLSLGVVSWYLLLSDESTERVYREALSILQLRSDAWAEACCSCYFAMWLVHMGRSVEAENQIINAALIEKRLDDSWLRGRIGLLRAWLHFEKHAYADAIAALTPVRRLSEDFDQHLFIDIYLGLAQISLGNVRAAAQHCLDALQMSIEFGNARGIGGCIEEYAYIEHSFGITHHSAQMLGVAERVRNRTSIPLIRFWTAKHNWVISALRAELGPDEFAAAFKLGQAMRLEIVADEVAHRLKDYLASDTLGGPDLIAAAE